jgi:hypothetical protein
MSLPNAYLVNHGQIKTLFEKIRQGQAPSRFTQQHLKDIGLGSSNWRAAIPVLKALGFLTADGAPTQRYHEYRDESRSRTVMGEALKESYSDLFVINENPSKADRKAIEGKFKSVHNAKDGPAGLMAGTFLSLLELADFDDQRTEKQPKQAEERPEPEPIFEVAGKPMLPSQSSNGLSLNYNIQIHLPATTDIEVYNAIFKSIRGNLID